MVLSFIVIDFVFLLASYPIFLGLKYVSYKLGWICIPLSGIVFPIFWSIVSALPVISYEIWFLERGLITTLAILGVIGGSAIYFSMVVQKAENFLNYNAREFFRLALSLLALFLFTIANTLAFVRIGIAILD